MKIPQHTIKPRPSALALLLCDTVIREMGTAKASIIGVWEHLNLPVVPTPERPFLHPAMTLYAKVIGAEGEYLWSFAFIRKRDSAKLAGGEIARVNHPSRMAQHELVVGLGLTPFFELGTYSFKLFADDFEVAAKDFEVVLFKQPEEGT